MSCYEPKIRVEDLRKWEKAKDGHFYHPAKIYTDTNLELYDKLKNPDYEWTTIGCGQCEGCQLDYARAWATRGYLESLYWKHNYFVTLTYDENNLPIPEEMDAKYYKYQDINGWTVKVEDYATFTKEDAELNGIPWMGTLLPEELKQFMKSLRQKFKRNLNHDGIRFMAAGEYGSKYKRPHYHLILFNAPFPINTFYEPKINWQKDTYYRNRWIEDIWDKGISNISDATYNSIGYVARYITKKQNGLMSNIEYAKLGQIKEFFRTSRRPGIGWQYYQDHKEEIYATDSILVKTKKGSIWQPVPKYFDTLYEKENPVGMEEIKNKRKDKMLNSLLVKQGASSLSRWEQYQVERRSLENRTKILQRSGTDK